MASRRGVYAGGSFGRVQVIVTWTLDHWKEFDAWCCVRGIDPLELPAYRFYNLAIYALLEEKPEDLTKHYEEILVEADKVKYPTYSLRGLLAVNYFAIASKKSVKSSPTAKKQKYVPSWWRGDETNAKVAMGMMTQLPR